jgi:capsid protein
MFTDLLEPVRAYLSRKRLQRLQCEAAANLLADSSRHTPCAGGRTRSVRTTLRESDLEDADAADWRLLSGRDKETDPQDLDTLRAKARSLADTNPYARNILMLYRDYVVGTGMKHEICDFGFSICDLKTNHSGQSQIQNQKSNIEQLWTSFLTENEWSSGNRKDWEFVLRTWRDGECFLRLFRQPTWPPRIHFVDPEHVAPDPATGLPSHGVETVPGNVEEPVAYYVQTWDQPLPQPLPEAGRGDERSCSPIPFREGGWGVRSERVPADRILHTKIGVDGNVKRGVTLFRPVLDALQRFQGWLEVELVHRKLASSIVLVRKHQQNYPGGVTGFADDSASSPLASLGGEGSGVRGSPSRRVKIQPGSIIDTQGFDLQYLSPDMHFDDASLLGRTILLSIAAGTGLPEFMLSADASNANYASTLVAEGPAVRHFAAWQAFFIGQWQKLFQMVMAEAVRLGLLDLSPTPPRFGEGLGVGLHLTPPPLAVRNRHAEAQADALYFDRGALSARELARRDGADAERMRKERVEEDL